MTFGDPLSLAVFVLVVVYGSLRVGQLWTLGPTSGLARWPVALARSLPTAVGTGAGFFTLLLLSDLTDGVLEFVLGVAALLEVTVGVLLLGLVYALGRPAALVPPSYRESSQQSTPGVAPAETAVAPLDDGARVWNWSRTAQAGVTSLVCVAAGAYLGWRFFTEPLPAGACWLSPLPSPRTASGDTAFRG